MNPPLLGRYVGLLRYKCKYGNVHTGPMYVSIVKL